MTIVDVADGLGVVEVRGDDVASVLYLHGEPVLLHAFDCTGSVGQLAARAGRNGPRPRELDALRDHLADPAIRVDPRTGTVEGLRIAPLRPLLRLLRSGRYRVQAHTPRWRDVMLADVDDRNVFSWYWPLTGDALIATDRWPAPGSTTVDGYRRRIAAGTRPAVVVVSPADGGVRYVLDGHHKLAAYRAEQVPPLLIEVSPEQPVPLRRETLEAALPERLRDAFSRPLGEM